MCLGCSKEPSHRDGSFEYPQHMFWLRNKKNNFLLRTLIWGLAGMTVFIFQCRSVKFIKENMFMYAGNSMEN